MRWLKFIVILLGLLIVCGVALLGYGFFKKSSQPDWKPFARSEQPAPAITPSVPEHKRRGPLPVFGDIKLDIPPPCHIASIQPERQRLYISLSPVDICNRIIVIDIADGRILGTISSAP